MGKGNKRRLTFFVDAIAVAAAVKSIPLHFYIYIALWNEQEERSLKFLVVGNPKL